MDLVGRAATDMSSLPEYIITNFLPGAKPLLQKYPKVFRYFGILLTLWYLNPVARFQTFWTQFSQLFVSTITVSSEEDLFQYLISWIGDKSTLRADQTLVAATNIHPNERRRRRADDFEEQAQKAKETPKIKYEQSQGAQIFIHNRRLFFIRRVYGEGHSYVGDRYRRLEDLSISCFGRTPQPIKDLMEEIYTTNKEKEKTMTIIRRPFTGGYSSRLNWSRLTAKPRRALDTVILDPKQKARVIKDVEEYMNETTQKFYGDHGIPYRRGYLFYGPPGCGKTSFCLALASKFNLDVYVLTLLDHDLHDSDLMSLMNQLPSPSLLLLEDIDTAGLSRKKPYADTSTANPFAASKKINPKKLERMGVPAGAIAAITGTDSESKDKDTSLDSEDEAEVNKQTTKVSLSGLLNAIDGVAAPEGHILIMTTNRAHELDDALVRAGRISVKVAFSNASRGQAEEIFLRMYVDLPQDSLDQSSASDIKKLASEFADLLPEGEFSPADLQDYLLTHKRSPQVAVDELPHWIEDKDEERRKKDLEKEAERKYRAARKEKKRAAFREDMKAAMQEGKMEDTFTAADNDDADATDNIQNENVVDTRPIETQMREAENEIARE